MVFSVTSPNPLLVVTRARFICSDFLNAIVSEGSNACGNRPGNRVECINMQGSDKIPQERFLSSTYAAFDMSSKRGVAAVIMRNNAGKVVAGNVIELNTNSAMVAEALGMSLAGTMLKEMGCPQPIIENDNELVVNACLGLTSPWEIGTVIDDIGEVPSEAGKFLFRKIDRRSTLVAHWVASRASKNILLVNWVATHPEELQSLVISYIYMYIYVWRGTITIFYL